MRKTKQCVHGLLCEFLTLALSAGVAVAGFLVPFAFVFIALFGATGGPSQSEIRLLRAIYALACAAPAVLFAPLLTLMRLRYATVRWTTPALSASAAAGATLVVGGGEVFWSAIVGGIAGTVLGLLVLYRSTRRASVKALGEGVQHSRD